MKRAGRASIPEIVVHNRQRSMAIDVPRLQRFARRALELSLPLVPQRGESLTRLKTIHVSLISDRRMSQLHRKFLRIAGPTDVITFQHGEIFISVQTAQRQAREFSSTLKREIRLYLVHGLLHLHGYDDRTPASRRLMASTQKQILRQAMRD
jgi:probable rRNA maturation factor